MSPKGKIEYYYTEGNLHLVISENLIISYAVYTGHIDIGDGIYLNMPKVVDLLEKAGKDLILCGPVVTKIQMRSDLREYYTGLPDNYDIPMFLGEKLSDPPIKLPLEHNSQGKEVEMYSVSFTETLKRKHESVMRLNPSTGRWAPKTGREADILDCYLLLLNAAYVDSSPSRIEYASQFGNYFKESIREFFPEYYEDMIKNSLL